MHSRNRQSGGRQSLIHISNLDMLSYLSVSRGDWTHAELFVTILGC